VYEALVVLVRRLTLLVPLVDFNGLRKLGVGGLSGAFMHSVGKSSLLPLKYNYNIIYIILRRLWCCQDDTVDGTIKYSATVPSSRDVND